MTNNANDKDKYTIHLLKRASKQKRKVSAQRGHELSTTVAPLYLARQLGHRSPQTTLPYVHQSYWKHLLYCKQQLLTDHCREILEQFQLEGESDKQKEEPGKEQSETSGDET
jgi:hypothetical protein